MLGLPLRVRGRTEVGRKFLKESKSYFREVAGSWDEMRAGYFTEEMRDAAIARAELSPDSVVADVGTGTGFVIRGLSPLVARVYGFDESPEMLDEARRTLGAYPNVELREAAGDHLPLAAGSLDAVFANMYLHHAPDPARAIAEMARVLRPGGRLVVTDLDSHDETWMREAMADRWLGFPRETIGQWFDQAGLTDLEVTCAKGSCCTSDPGGKKLSLSVFAAFGRKG
jgi:ubiquinone/menaquinone biosynthesis C-methylase UbiE